LRATVRRDYGREVRVQRRLRASDVRELRQSCFAEAVAFANRMTAESPGYRARLERDGLRSPITAESWSRLPVLTKKDFRVATDSWYGTRAHKEGVTWTFTSGSTSEPFRFPLSKPSQIADSVAQELNLLAVGWNPAMRRATIKAEPKSPRGLRKAYRVLMGNQEIAFPAADFRVQHVPALVERFRAEGISYLRGYSTSIYLFAQEVLRRSLPCTIPLITTLGEGLSPKQAEVVERAFNGKVYRDYGGSEAMHIGFECRERNGYHVDLARFHVEIIRDGRPALAGEPGDIVVTAFRNAAMPLVRYSIGDVGSWAVDDDPCPCGNRFPRLAEVLGRSADFLVTSQGRLINAPLLQGVFEYALEHVEQYQVVQKDGDRFDVLWVARHDRAGECIPALEQHLHALIGDGVSFGWRQVAEIPPAKSGKRQILVPLLA
jgi:phenylacetate-CoA ligase